MNDSNAYDVTQDDQGQSSLSSSSSEETSFVQPVKQIGRYTVERVLGKGGFGIVYLARDETLGRLVAIKLPHAKLISKPEDAEAYLNEARTVANLDHPGIVPVYDVGGTHDFPCFVVSKYIDGTDLRTILKQHRMQYREASELVATVAEALHYAHKQGLVHRDVKPGNILISRKLQPFVVDFGLALREENIGKGPRYAGTPAYMSPEQRAGEGHRVDGRSDIFSLGVVLYEMLAGRRPFRGETQGELSQQISSYEAKPLRQYDEKVPMELERICLKAMQKLPRDRYPSAHDMAVDLWALLQEQTVIQGSAPSLAATWGSADTRAAERSVTSVGSVTAEATRGEIVSERPPIKVVPKGLRSFDAHDADFFLELVPGPRDRNGLPDSLRFWKTRIEETDCDSTFSVGLIYGPSGCGKSSLVKAGLLPRLSDEVISIYIEATPEETETRILNGLRKRCPALDASLGLKESLAALRRGQGLRVGQKVLVVLDQFEQWLHAKKEEENTELVQALRQCDGAHVQCIVMVRDDFWLAATRFMGELEVELLQGQNTALADLFDVGHAQKVLAAFGRAFGALPEQISETTKDQNEFLKQSVEGLAEDGKVICVRLALFAEMMKGRSWTTATLREVGGTKGIGVTFLDETFSAKTAHPKHRLHQKAARAVLKDLLPDSGTDIKGYMRSHAELLEASGYGSRPKDFDDLIRILDREIRLITPTDPDGKDDDDKSVTHTEAGLKYFQLTHDYLVHSLRDWLTRKQKETRKGRAELRLFDTSLTWNARPKTRFLPSWWEHLTILLLTDKKKWTIPQQKMMAAAGRTHGLRSLVVIASVAIIAFAGFTIRNAIAESRQQLLAEQKEEQRKLQAAALVQGLLQADTVQVKEILETISPYWTYAEGDLNTAFAESEADSNGKLHAALALLSENTSTLPFLSERLLILPAHQFAPVCELLVPHKEVLIADYWRAATDPQFPARQRFQAACALANYDAASDRWNDEQLTKFIVDQLVNVLPSELLPWRTALRPAKAHLVAPLGVIYRDAGQDSQRRGFATDVLADYLDDNAEALFDLLADANEKQFGPIFDRLQPHREKAIQLGNAVLSDSTTPHSDDALTRRHANVAIMLLRLNAADNVWPLLRYSPDLSLRSYLIDWLAIRGADPNTLIARYDLESDATIKRALLLCFGGFELSEGAKQPLIEKVSDVYQNDPDAGLHAASEWLLRHWGQAEAIAAINAELKQSEDALRADETATRRWYVNTQGQTYVIVDADQFDMGSTESEAGRSTNETRHRRRIGRRIAIASKEVTREEWRVFDNATNTWSGDQDALLPFLKTDDSPMIAMTWFNAAHYCNWLSEQEGIPEAQWCYTTNADGRYGPGMMAKENFLGLKGYRLPTEAEWEYCCRSGASTSRFYGTTDELLPRYAWYLESDTDYVHPVGVWKPNDFGLFDVYGNVGEWCYDVYAAYPTSIFAPASDSPPVGPVEVDENHVVRGGSVREPRSEVRSGQRAFNRAGLPNVYIGLRPARTYSEFPQSSDVLSARIP